MLDPKPLGEMLSLVGRTVLVSGAASGIGRAIAARFAEAGAGLVLVDLDEAGLASVRDELVGHAVSVDTHAFDLSHKEAVDRMWDGFGDAVPDTLVNNAGVYLFEEFTEMDEAALARTIELNLESVFWMCQGFIRRRIDSGGVVVNVASIEALLPFKEHLVSYAMSKAGVIALTRSLARDYGRKGFRINALVPGSVRTPGTDKLVRQAMRTLDFKLMKTGYDFNARLPLGRWGTPDEVALAALFLCSDMASYVQGALVPVDGGFLSA
jgi:NAD(P)-dependent dehydrogenase (short-subunit alcohol dehydrogenase family)